MKVRQKERVPSRFDMRLWLYGLHGRVQSKAFIFKWGAPDLNWRQDLGFSVFLGRSEEHQKFVAEVKYNWNSTEQSPQNQIGAPEQLYSEALILIWTCNRTTPKSLAVWEVFSTLLEDSPIHIQTYDIPCSGLKRGSNSRTQGKEKCVELQLRKDLSC